MGDHTGYTVAQVANALHVPYGFAYGVHRRWRESGRLAFGRESVQARYLGLKPSGPDLIGAQGR